MKVNSITIDGFALAVTPMGNRLYRIDNDVYDDVNSRTSTFYFVSD